MSRSAARRSPDSSAQNGVGSSSGDRQSPGGSSPLARSAVPLHPRPLPGAFFGDYVNSFGRGGKKKRIYQRMNANENTLDLRDLADAASAAKRSSRSPLATPGSLSRSLNASVRQTPVLRPQRGMDPPTQILDFLFLGTVYDAQDALFLAQNNIRYIINVSTEEYWSADKRVIVFPFKIMDTVDSDISALFKNTRNIIERCRQEYFKAKQDAAAIAVRRKLGTTQGTPLAKPAHPPCVLVHCQKGRSRSATIVLAYLIYRNGWSVAEALEYVTKLRPVVEPNLGFMDCLLKLQESLDPDERNRRCGQQSLCVRNIPLATSPATVAGFFEERVGMVRSVVMHGLGAPSAPLPQSTDAAEANTEVAAAADGDNTLSEEAGAVATVGDVGCVGHTDQSTPVAAMSLIMFPCFENVKRAKEYAEAHMPEVEHMLGTVPGKDIKLMVPSKLRPAGGSFTGSTARANT